VKVLEPIKTKFNDNELFHLTLGNSYLALGDKKNGEATLLLALKLNHENPSTYFFLISFYLSTGKNKEVSELLIKAESVFENNKMVLSKFDDLKEKIKCLTA
jgi:hypothetical protein